MLASELYKRPPYLSKEVYVVGTGPSMRAKSVWEFLYDKEVILLNDCWKFCPSSMLGTAFSNNLKFLGGDCKHTMVCKGRLKSNPHFERDDNHVPWNHSKIHVFSYRDRAADGVSHFDACQLWREPNHYWNVQGGTVAIFAVQFAVQAGARSVVLVGCDCCDITGREYMSKKQTAHRIKMSKQRSVVYGGPLQHDYSAYRKGLVYLSKRCLSDFGVPVVSLTPFFGLGDHAAQLPLLS